MLIILSILLCIVLFIGSELFNFYYVSCGEGELLVMYVNFVGLFIFMWDLCGVIVILGIFKDKEKSLLLF